MMWTDMELHKFRVACAPYGGPIGAPFPAPTCALGLIFL